MGKKDKKKKKGIRKPETVVIYVDEDEFYEDLVNEALFLAEKREERLRKYGDYVV